MEFLIGYMPFFLRLAIGGAVLGALAGLFALVAWLNDRYRFMDRVTTIMDRVTTIMDGVIIMDVVIIVALLLLLALVGLAAAYLIGASIVGYIN